MTKKDIERTAKVEIDGYKDINSVLLALHGQPTDPAKEVEVSGETFPERLQNAFETIRKTWSQVVLTTARALAPKELKSVLEEAQATKVARLTLAKREKELKEYIKAHLNSLPEAANAPRDKDGNAILAQPKKPFVLEIEGHKVTQTYVNGSVSVDPELLKEAFEEGRLNSHQYYKSTAKVETREFNPEGAMEIIRKNPELLQVFKDASRSAPPSATLKF